MYRRHQMGKRRVVLLSAAAMCFSRAINYLPGVRHAPIQEPILAAAANNDYVLALLISLWAATGAYCLLNLRSGNLIKPISLTAGMMATWAAAWLWGWLTNLATDWWLTVFTYGASVGMILGLVTLTPRWAGEDN